MGVGASDKVDLILKKFLIPEKSVSLCSPASLQLYSVEQAGPKFTDPPASASPALGLKTCATMPSLLPRTSTRHQVQEAGVYFPEVFTEGAVGGTQPEG